MTKNDLYEAGEEILDLVQDAVEHQDFSQLSSTINTVVNQAADGMQEMLRESLRAYYGSRNRRYVDGRWQEIDPEKKEDLRNAAEEIRSRMQDFRMYKDAEAAERIRREQAERIRARQAAAGKPLKAAKRTPGIVSGNVMKWTGIGLAGMFGLSMALMALIGLGTGIAMYIPMGILGVFLGGSAGLGIFGAGKVGLAKRFQTYMDIMGERNFCRVEELADATGRSVDYVRKDLKKMIQKGMIKEGHMDQNGTFLITDDMTYRQYLDTQQEYEKKETAKRQAETAQETAKRSSSLSKECQALIDEGNRYIRHIHECNDRIPGEEITEKLSRLETVVTRIFTEVEKRPELAPELRKMMSYYLPTTQKLIDAYVQLDGQKIAGQNIDTTKKEIETALDTINTAFENLLDSFFENTAWDISSDISVLNTMFAQEGLTAQKFGE